jgi:hypothetical protein
LKRWIGPTPWNAQTPKRWLPKSILKRQNAWPIASFSKTCPTAFAPETPRFLQFPLRSVWIVPVVLSYPRIGPVGQAGIAAVDTETGSVVGWTPLDEMKKAAEAIYERKKAAIEAAF